MKDQIIAWAREYFSSDGPGRKIQHIRKDEMLFRKGEEAAWLYRVLAGQVKLVTTSVLGKTATHEVCGPRRWLFEGAVDSQHLYMHSAVAMTDSSVMAFERRQFCALLADHQYLAVTLSLDLALQLEGVRNSLDAQMLTPADRRLAHWFLGRFENDVVRVLPIEMTPTRIGELISSTRQHAHRIIDKFLELGILTKRDSDRYLVHKGALEKFLTDDEGEPP
jgi:CRP-like cAMP-binding protein